MQYMTQIQNLTQERENSVTIHLVEQVINRAHPHFYMFNEQNGIPNYEIKATRVSTGPNGNTLLFFGSMQSSKIIKVWKNI